MGDVCDRDARSHQLKAWDGKPMNQAKVLHEWTDPLTMRGHFNWTYDLQYPLDVAIDAFPANATLGEWEWWYDKEKRKGFVRLYLRVNEQYPWICQYFGADAGRGIKGNQAYDGRGMMLETPTTPDFLVRFSLNVTKNSTLSSWYFLNSEACWDQKTRKPCVPYGDTNTMSHQQVLLDWNDRYNYNCSHGCPRYHIFANGSRVHRDDPRYPRDAYGMYCVSNACDEAEGEPMCDETSNSNPQSIYKLRPHPEWAQYGFPSKPGEGFVGDPRTWELNVGRLWEHMWFPCDQEGPKEIVSLNIGPEAIGGIGSMDTEWIVSDFDVLVPDEHLTFV